MNKPVNFEEIKAMYSAIGSALSNWTRVEIQLYQIFGAVHVLTIMQAGGGFSSDMRTPYAALDAVDGFSSKMRMVDRALKSALRDLDEDALGILHDWDKAKDKVASLHNNCRNSLAHWTVGSGFTEGAQVRLIPPPYSSRAHQGLSITDIQSWEAAFIVVANRLVNIVERLTSHQGLQRKFTMQTIEQISISLPKSSALADLFKNEF